LNKPKKVPEKLDHGLLHAFMYRNGNVAPAALKLKGTVDAHDKSGPPQLGDFSNISTTGVDPNLNASANLALTTKSGAF
jgi:hypothetical protein